MQGAGERLSGHHEEPLNTGRRHQAEVRGVGESCLASIRRGRASHGEEAAVAPEDAFSAELLASGEHQPHFLGDAVAVVVLLVVQHLLAAGVLQRTGGMRGMDVPSEAISDGLKGRKGAALPGGREDRELRGLRKGGC